MIFYALAIVLEITSVDAAVDCIEVRTQEKGFIRLTVEFDATKQGYTSNITTVDQILRRVFITHTISAPKRAIEIFDGDSVL